MTALQPVPDIRYPFADLEKRMGGGTAAELAHRLELPLSEVRRMRTAGLTAGEAEEAATSLELNLDDIWLPATPIPESLPGGFEWVEAPPSWSRHSDDLTGFVRPLLAHPGRWAKVKHYDSPASANSAQGRVRKGVSVPPGRWESASRKTAGGGSDLYVRYLGPPEP